MAQPPQLAGSVAVFTHVAPGATPPSTLPAPPSCDAPPHSFKPAAQLVPHVPPEQTSPCPHTFPQPPQLLLSVCSSTQRGAPASTAQSACPAEQVEVHLP